MLKHKKMKTKTHYMSVGINQTKKSLDWNWNLNLIAYGASNQIVLYDPQESCIVGISNESHGGYINSIQWIRNRFSQNKNFLLSTSTNGSAKLWIFEGTRTDLPPGCIKNSLKAVTTLTGHQGSVACADALIDLNQENEANKIFVVTTAEDNLIKGWKINSTLGTSEELFSYKLPGRSLALELLILPAANCWPLIVYGGDDGKVHVMVSQEGEKYEPKYALTGHQDWVTSLAYWVEDEGDTLLSSGSKDGSIRLWRISTRPREALDPSLDLLRVKSLQMTLAPRKDPDEEGRVAHLQCSLESVLLGHEGLVSSLDWDRSEGGRARLLSCAKTEDRSVVTWEPEPDGGTDCEESGLWVEKVRLGEVGGNREGFFRAAFGPGGDQVAAISYQGGFHLWQHSGGMWTPRPVASGHFGEVVDLAWDEEGRYLLSASKDQTTRLHSQWAPHPDKVIWREIARPQVHGFDMACVASLDGFCFASAGEEKVVRGFSATKRFVRSWQRVAGRLEDPRLDSLNLPELASVPSLGLSNKGEEQTGSIKEAVPLINDGSEENGSTDPPTEDELMLGTLWPEISKLYGHGNELLSLASSHDGTLLASSCRATTDLDAKIILWNTKEWREHLTLSYHRLSVTQIQFSDCDRFILSVSRDRSWAVFERGPENAFSLKFESGSLSKKSHHSRIIWSCAWVPRSLHFVTGSRDKTVVVWRPVCDGEGRVTSWDRGAVINVNEEVVAVAVERLAQEQKWLIAIGCANGSLLTKLFDDASNAVLESSEIEIPHRKSVRRLQFRPRADQSQSEFTLASCGNDNAVYLHQITL